MDRSVSVAGVADLKMCYLEDIAGYIYERKTHTAQHNTYLAKCRQGRLAVGANFDGGEGDET